jgi:hypothetical protein
MTSTAFHDRGRRRAAHRSDPATNPEHTAPDETATDQTGTDADLRSTAGSATQTGTGGLFSAPPQPPESARTAERAVTVPFAAGPVPAADPATGAADTPADPAVDRHAPGNPTWSSPSTDATGEHDEADPRARRGGTRPTARRTYR